jgi:hypothetical protein
MNIAKNMEAIFFAAIALISVTSFASAESRVARSAPVAIAAVAAVADTAAMQTVTVSAKRMTAAEKAAAQ